MLSRSGLFAAIAAVFVAGGAHADPLGPVQGRSVDLGTLSGVVYYTVEANFYRVVATLQTTGAQPTPVRFVATLAPEQSITLSAPRGAGEPAIEVRFVRRGAQMFVDRGDTVADGAQTAELSALR